MHRNHCLALLALLGALVFGDRSTSQPHAPIESPPQVVLLAPREPAKANEEILRKLEKEMDVDFAAIQLDAALKSLAKSAEVPLILERYALKEVGIDEQKPVTLHLKKIPIRSALTLMLKEVDLCWCVRDEALVVTTPEERNAELIVRAYQVEDLLEKEPWQFAFADFDSLKDLITSTCAPTTWDYNGPSGQSDFGSSLMFAQALEVHEEVEALLAALRKVKATFDKWDGRERPADLRPIPTWPVRGSILDSWEAAREKPITLSLDKVPLEKFAKLIGERTGLPTIIDNKALQDVGIDLQLPITYSCKDLPLERALRESLEPHDLAVRLYEGTLQILTKEEQQARLETWLFPVFDLVEDLPAQEDFNFGAYVASRNHPANDLAELIESSVRPETWHSSGGPGAATIFWESRALVVSQTPEVIREVEAMLAKLRKSLPVAKKTDRAQAASEWITREYKRFPAAATAEQCAEAVRKFVAPESWTRADSKAKIEIAGNRLIITQQPAVHEEIRELLYGSGFGGGPFHGGSWVEPHVWQRASGEGGGLRVQTPAPPPPPERRARKRLPGVELTPAQIFAALEKRGDFAASGMPWKQAIQAVEKIAGLPIAIDEEGIHPIVLPAVTRDLKNVSARTILGHLLDDAGLAFTIRHGHLWIDTRAQAKLDAYPEVYPLGNLIQPIGEAPAHDFRQNELYQQFQLGGQSRVMLGSLVVTADAAGHEEAAALLTALKKAKASALKWNGKDRPLPDVPPDGAWRCQPTRNEAWEQARRKPITLEFDSASLAEVVKVLAAKTSLPFQLDYVGLEEEGARNQNAITFACDNMPLESALAHLCRICKLRVFPWREAILITPPGAARERTETWVFPVYDLVGPNADADTFFPRNAPLDFDALIDLIIANIAVTDWDTVGGPGEIDAFSQAGALVVESSPDRLREIALLLEMVRRLTPPASWPDPQRPETALITQVYSYGNGAPFPPKTKLNVTMPEAAELIRARIEPESWKKEGVKLEALPFGLIVRQRREVHLKIRRYLHTFLEPTATEPQPASGGMGGALGGGFFN